MKRLLFVIVSCAGFLVGNASSTVPLASVAFHGPRIHDAAANSLNWSGYAAYPSSGNTTTFSNVQGSWTQPAATCPKGQQYSSFWVGIDGYNSSTVEQIGTEADCLGKNQPVHYAWYEMYPNPVIRITSVPIHPGDQVSAAVSYAATSFSLSLTNVTTGASFTTTATLATAQWSSAEWVAEAPAIGNHILPLANFGTVNFTGSYATGDGHTGSVSDGAWTNDQISMVTMKGVKKAVPSGLTGGTDFHVDWKHQ